MHLDVALIVVDAATQIRGALRESVIAQYAEQMQSGAAFPPVVVFEEAGRYLLADGFHRLRAVQLLGAASIEVIVRHGGVHDALWYALGANREHGLQMSDVEKQHAVWLALMAWPDKLHTEIAKQVGCSESLVSQVSSKFSAKSGVRTGLAARNEQKRVRVI